MTFGLAATATLLGSALWNGVILGQARAHGISFATLLWLTLPHSLELAGLWLAGGIGLLGTRYSSWYLRGKFPPSRTLLQAALLEVVFTVVAVCLEVYVTLRHVVPYYQSGTVLP